MTQRDPRAVLTDALGERKELVDAAVSIFELAQFLLDDDQRLTKTGALDGVGREQLQVRTLELLGGPPATDPDEDEQLRAAAAGAGGDDDGFEDDDDAADDADDDAADDAAADDDDDDEDGDDDADVGDP